MLHGAEPMAMQTVQFGDCHAQREVAVFTIQINSPVIEVYGQVDFGMTSGELEQRRLELRQSELTGDADGPRPLQRMTNL